MWEMKDYKNSVDLTIAGFIATLASFNENFNKQTFA